MPDAMPVGTVLPFGGPLVTPAQIQALEDQGWRLCDGALLSATDFPALYAVLGMAHGGQRGNPDQFNLPDLRGRFVRGVNDNALVPGGGFVDPDVGQRSVANPGGNAGNAVGSYQPHATALPSLQNRMVTTADGAHSHSFCNTTSSTHKQWKGSNVAWAIPGVAVTRTSRVDAHSHTIVSGGDAETRPMNLALNWIIKVADAT